MPKSNRDAPWRVSIPIWAMSRPIRPPIQPFRGMSLVTMEPQISTPNRASIKYSGLVNFRAMLVRGGAMRARARMPMKVPMMEARRVTLLQVHNAFVYGPDDEVLEFFRLR